MSKTSPAHANSGSERRKTKRRPILATFSVFVVVPKKGVHRLGVQDISEDGVGFEFDTEGESVTDFPVSQGDVVDFRFYLNQSLYLPLAVEVARVEEHGGIRRVGGEFRDKNSKTYKAFLSFLHMLDAIADEVMLEGN